MCYCTSAETGGYIPDTQIERFGGGAKKKQKIAALVREQLWIRVEDGYSLNPDLWTEERNLSGAAEKKKEADRRRIAAKRTAARAAQNGRAPAEVSGMSRDSRATCRATPEATDPATCSRDSRPPEKRREEIHTADPVSQLPVADARQDDDDFDDETTARVASALADKAGRLVGPGEARKVIALVLAKAEKSGTNVQSVAAYVLAAITAEEDVYDLLLDPVPTLREIHADDAPDGIHAFDDDGYGPCQTCNTPATNWHHPRRRPA